jgi:hypothetical protein
VATGRERLFIDGQHGLGNRLRAIGSAAAIAAATGRELVIVWQPDAHCDCRFADLFDYPAAVIDESFARAAPALGCDVVNYMTVEPGGTKDAPVLPRAGRDLYLRSAFVLKHPASGWERENAFLRGLRPVEPVRALVAGVRHPNALAAHVRMEAGPGRDGNAWDRPDGNWTAEDHAAIHHWRERSHFSRFFARIDALAAAGAADTIFVAADLPETYAAFAERYGARLAWLRRDLWDRSAAQLQHALADAILLGHAPRLLASTWSSFSELAMRLAPAAQTVETSGRDF